MGEWADPHGVDHGADPDGEESGGEEREAGCTAEHLTKGVASERVT